MRQRLMALVLLAMSASLCGCDAGSASSGSPNVDPRFASAEALVEHINSLGENGFIRMRDLTPLIYAESDFQQTLKQTFETIVQAETIQDAVMDRFGEPVDPDAGDLRISFFLELVGVSLEEGGRASALATHSTGDFREMMLVRVGHRWWVSGYTWEYSMSDARKEELPRRTLAYQIDAAVAPELVSRINAGAFASIDQFRQAHRDALLAYLEANPDVYKRLTGKSIPGT